VSAVLEDGETVDGDILVGADGSWSAVRKAILGDEGWKPTFMNASGIYGISRPLSPSPTPSSKGNIVLLDIAGISTWPLPDGRQFWNLTLPETQPPTAKSTVVRAEKYPLATINTGGYTLESTLDALTRLEAHWFPSAPDDRCGGLFANSERIVRAPLYQLVFSESQIVNHAGTVALIGDAARVMLPTSGQGACMGIEDATVLANCLLNNESLGEALGSYARLRVPRSRRIAGQAYYTGAVFMAERWWLRWIRDLATGWMPSGRDAKA
jgi:2-polyprenyl-6-methoxyphenol hydroxylase-like FAD-dependent oxidoreductase